MPTDDALVKVRLREMKEPICKTSHLFVCVVYYIITDRVCPAGLFGEGPADRRVRLRSLIADFGVWFVVDLLISHFLLICAEEKGIKMEEVKVSSIDPSKLDVS